MYFASDIAQFNLISILLGCVRYLDYTGKFGTAFDFINPVFVYFSVSHTTVL